MRSLRVTATLCALSVLVAGGAQAEEVPAFSESPRYLILELKLGSFSPLIDREPSLNGATPFASTFGANASMLRFELELEKYVYQGYGSVTLGLGAGYAEIFAAGRTATTDSVSTEKVGLRFYPVRAEVAYRFDYAALHWNVPLVPYGKAALVYMPWQAATGDKVDSANGITGAGGRWGYALTGGLAFMLDIVQPRFARELDAEVGINHTYFFAEYVFEEVNNFNRGGLDLSSRRFMFGLALDI